jgi:drug/metabolite transporter (DMT)-like permease
MIAAIALVVLAGGCWAIVGVAYSQASARRCDPLLMIAVSGGLVALAALAAVDWRALPGQTRMAEFIPLMMACGVAGCIGMLGLQRAMRTGGHGIAWGIAQSAMVVPFLAAVFFHGEHALARQWLALGIIVAAIVTLGRTRDGSTEGRRWFWWALLAMLCLGMQQTLFQAPSHWQQWSDQSRLRVPLFMAASAVTAWVLFAARKSSYHRRIWRPALAAAAANTVGQLAMAAGLNRLAAADAARAGYPVAISVCIFAFSLYSLTVRRERAGFWTLAALAGVILGVVLMAI